MTGISSGDTATGAWEVTLSASSSRYDCDSDGWLAQEGDLLAALSAEVGTISRAHRAAGDATKGVGETVVIGLASAQLIVAMVDCVRSWLQRDTSRRVTIEWTVDGRTETLTIRHSDLDEETLFRLQEAFRARIGE